MRRRARIGNLDAHWSHLMCDGDTGELIEFASRLGMRPAWIQKVGTTMEHFDLTDPKRLLALRLGARAIVYGHEGYELMVAKKAGVPFDLDGCRAENPHEAPNEQLDLF